MGLDEAAQAEPVWQSENDINPIVDSDTVDATVDAQVPNGYGGCKWMQQCQKRIAGLKS
jgi:hypothetical protein